MKKITLFLSLLLAFSLGYGQTTLTSGDIAITGFNSDNPDTFSFVLLTNVATSTSINFTDNGWFSAGGFRDNEGTITWTADIDLPCGTEIVIQNTGPNTYSATHGTATESNLGFAIVNTVGDQILAYQGPDASPTFIYAVNFDGAGWSDATSPNDTALPTGLTDGTNAINFGQIDNAIYDCSVTSDTSLVLAAVSTIGNWTLDNNPLTIGGCYYSCASCSGGTVTWSGGAWSGTPDLTTQVIISDNYNTANGGTEVSFSACSVFVEAGFTLNIDDGDYIRIQNDITVDGNMADGNGEILVQSGGAVVQIDDAANVAEYGSITVTKTTANLNAWYEYTYWSSPVSGETIDGGLFESEASRRYIFNAQNFLDSTMETGNDNTANPGQDDIDDNGNDWQRVNGATTMESGVGYAATHSKLGFVFPGVGYDYSFEGPFNNGVITVPVYRNDSEIADNNWNLIGNPYPSAINADLFLAANAAINSGGVVTNSTLDGAIFLWSQNTAPSAIANGNETLNFANSDYAIINGTGETMGGDGVTPNRLIPSGQAFFVTMSNGAAASLVSGDVYTADVTFNNSMRVFGATDNSQFFKNTKQTKKESGSSSQNKLWVDLTSDNGVFNQALIGYVNGATNDFDGMYYDAIKNLSSNTSASLYSTIEGNDIKLAIQGKNLNSLDENETIQLGFKTNIKVATLYKLSLAKTQGDFLTSNPVFLKDNLLDRLHNLSISDYTFTSELGEFNDRFKIVFNKNLLSTDDIVHDSNTLQIVELKDNNVKFTAPSAIKTVKVLDLLGRQLYEFEGANTSETYNLSTLSSMVYIAKVQLSNGITLTKKAIKQ